MPNTYRAYQSQPSGRYFCPVPGCTGDLATEASLQVHFQSCHPVDLVHTPRAGCPPKCNNCGLQVLLKAMNSGHQETQQCKVGRERAFQHLRAANSIWALQEKITAYDKELEQVELFKYLGQLVSFNDKYAHIVRSNLMKARAIWPRVSKVLMGQECQAPGLWHVL